jgi:SAM-dependent methyltransferase
MSSINKTEKFWDRLANQFDKLSRHFEKPPSEKAKKFLSVDDIVLDYGCATGTVAIELASYVKEIKGIDISSRMIDAAKGKVSELKIENIDFLQASISIGAMTLGLILPMAEIYFIPIFMSVSLIILSILLFFDSKKKKLLKLD